MEHTPPRSQPSTAAAAARMSRAWLWSALLATLGLVAYHNTFSNPFIFDDHPAIETNATIKSLWSALVPPSEGSSVTGRPVVNLSFALNYATSGTAVTGYHVVNLAIHLGAGLLLFGLVRRTLERLNWGGLVRHDATVASLLIAGLWLVHPLQTESVAFVVQRTESLAGFFYLLTLYGFVRSAESPESRAWPVVAVAAALLGMATKEVLVSAPLIVWLYDRTFIAGSFAEAWRQRRGFYCCLAATWLALLGLVVSQHGARHEAHGFDPATNSWTYLLTQCRAILLYLRLSVWPHPLIVDYGTEVVRTLETVWPQAVLLAVAFASSMVGLWRKPIAGFLGVCFFALLAPSSSVVPLPAQTMAEHRMYLPLAVVVVVAVIGLRLWLGRRGLMAGLLAAVACTALTVARNHDYRSEEAIWRDTTAKLPGNWRPHHSLACVLPVQSPETIAEFETSLRLKPDNVDGHTTLANTLNQIGRREEAIAHCLTALKLRPDSLAARRNLGTALVLTGRVDEAASVLEQALAIRPDDALCYLWLGSARFGQGKYDECIRCSEAALKLKPDLPDAWVNIGSACLRRGDTAAAMSAYEAALRQDPHSADALCNIGTCLLEQGRIDAAIRYFRAALQNRPAYGDAHNNLGTALLRQNRLPEAIAEYRNALQVAPNHYQARINLGTAYAMAGANREAIAEYEAALRLRPNDEFATAELNRLNAALKSVRQEKE